LLLPEKAGANPKFLDPRLIADGINVIRAIV
jgi:hypothetical protein